MFSRVSQGQYLRSKKQAIMLLIVSLFTFGLSAKANGLQAGSMQSLSGYSSSNLGLGPEQDSLLPPEVLPIDPSLARSMSHSQAEARQAGVNNSSFANTYAYDQGANSAYTSQAPSAQEMRKQAFQSLYGNAASLSPDAMQQAWRATGQQESIANNYSNNYSGANLVNNNGQAQNQVQQMPNNYVAQSQTLTGGAKNQPQIKNIKRAGVSNVLNYASAFGVGALTSSFFRNPYNPWLGAGMYGASMTGFGTRNGFRF